MRPEGLSAEDTPVPESDSSPRPIADQPSGVASGMMNQGVFETLAGEEVSDGQVPPPPKLQEDEKKPITTEGEGKKFASVWRRRGMSQITGDEYQRPQHSVEPQGNGSGNYVGLEQALGEHVVEHFQRETSRLQAQNDQLMREVRLLREQKEQSKPPSIPTSWDHGRGSVAPPASPPKPTTSFGQSPNEWASPMTFKCTPNGTRIPEGPPPPTPPPLPEWPPILKGYERVGEPPRKYRGVMGEAVYKVSGERTSPRDDRTTWLEQQVEDLQQLLYQQALSSNPVPGYFATPFMTESQKAREICSAAARLRRHAGIQEPSGDGQVKTDPRLQCLHGDLPLDGRACTSGSALHEHGDQPHEARAGTSGSASHDHGERALQDRAGYGSGSARDEGAQGVRASGNGSAAQQVLGEQLQRGRASNVASVLGDVCPHGRASRHRSASRGDREQAEDADLKSVPVTLPVLPPPEGREASLDGGDWLIQLEPLIGDLSRNATTWWKRTMAATSTKYNQWLRAEPLQRLHICAPTSNELPAGFERLDQRVTSLLLHAVPKAVKDEVVATRELSTAGILYRVFRTYQPGGLSERSRLLEDLTTPSPARTPQEAVNALRLWKRKANRAAELCTQLPDPLLMTRALDGIAKPILDGFPQAAFRISTFRMNQALDVRPTVETVWLFFDLLLAEAEVAVHSGLGSSTGEPKTPPRPTVKAMQSTPSTGATHETSPKTPWPCKFWMSDGGCKQGQRCRWPHSWEGHDKTSRCWNCSSNQHQQQDCPFKSPVRPPAGGDGEGKHEAKKESKGGGKGKGKSGKTKDKPDGKKETSQPDDKKDEKTGTTSTTSVDEKSKTGQGGGDEKKPAAGTAELLQEATKLLKSLHLPSVKTISLQEIGEVRQGGKILVDSGATHALRKAKTWDEWAGASETTVALAQGTTQQLRLKPGTCTLLSSPTDESFGNGILPMGALARMNYEVQWTGGSCRIHGPDGQIIETEVVNGCPMVDETVGVELMTKLEQDSKLMAARTAMVRALIQQPDLLRHLSQPDPAVLLAVALQQQFPGLPEEICQKVVPTMKEVQGHELPWNRRRRRQLERAQRIILHVFSGRDEKTWKSLERGGTVVLCIDKLLHPKMDLMSDSIMNYLLRLASTGKIVAILGGPPCRTVSACRYVNDGGPGPVRSEAEPYGMRTLTLRQRDQVIEDATLLFKMKLLYMVACQCKPIDVDKVLFGLEQPRDPAEYRSKEDVEEWGFMSIFRTEEWKIFQQQHQLRLVHFEQGAFGHKRPKPTTFAHNIDGFDALDGATMSSPESSNDSWRELPLEDRMKASAQWAEWAPGLKAALIEGIQRHLDGLSSLQPEAQLDEPRPQLCPMTAAALSRWKLHIENDHQPMRRDCRQCVEAAGRSRPHRRVQHPSAYCLSLDLSGRLKKGKDQFAQAHKYFVIGTYTFPTTKDDLPLTGPVHDGDPADIPLPSLEEAVAEDGLEDEMEDYELPRLDVEEDQELEADEGDQQALATARSSYDNWMKLVEHHQDVKVKTLTFVELIPTRHKGHILEAISKIYSKIRSLGLTVLRLHADRAKEFTSKVVQQWCYERDIVATYTSGSDWKSNGRAENEVGIVKRHSKVLMKVHGVEETRWPLLVRHAAERRLRWQLRQVGYQVPALLPFNTKVLVKRKSWSGRYDNWRWDRVEGVIVGPDPLSSLTSGGYCVQLTDGKFVASSDVVVQHPGLGEGEVVRMVIERQEGEPPPAAEQPVRRRLRGKQTVPHLAALELVPNSGEKDYDGEHLDGSDENQEWLEDEQARLLELHEATSKVLNEECRLIDDLQPVQAHLIPSLAMLANQKFDLEQQLCSLDAETRRIEEEENYLVTKTIAVDQVYKEWDDWIPAMESEYQSLVVDKAAVRQMPRSQAKLIAQQGGMKFEELPSKVVFTRKSGGKHKVRACVCGNYEGPVSAATYAGGCDASQIRCTIRHAALKRWKTYSADIKCAFLNAPRQDKTKLVVMKVPSIYVKLGKAQADDVWVIDAAVYGLMTSPRDWADHRDKQVPGVER